MVYINGYISGSREDGNDVTYMLTAKINRCKEQT